MLLLATYCLLLAGSLLWYSKVQKQREAQRLLALVRWRGAERVLDVAIVRSSPLPNECIKFRALKEAFASIIR